MANNKKVIDFTGVTADEVLRQLEEHKTHYRWVHKLRYSYEQVEHMDDNNIPYPDDINVDDGGWEPKPLPPFPFKALRNNNVLYRPVSIQNDRGEDNYKITFDTFDKHNNNLGSTTMRMTYDDCPDQYEEGGRRVRYANNKWVLKCSNKEYVSPAYSKPIKARGVDCDILERLNGSVSVLPLVSGLELV